MAALERILVGIDLSKSSEPLAEFAIGVASRYGAELVFAYIVDELVVEHAGAGYDPNKVIEALVREAKRMLETLVAKARDAGVHARYVLYDRPADPAVALALLAEEEDVSEVAVAHKGHKLFRIIPVGSTTLGLIGHATKPVLIAKPEKHGDTIKIHLRESLDYGDILKRVIIAIDRNVNNSMISYIKELISKGDGAVEEVYVIHVIEPNEDEASAKRLVEDVIKSIQEVFSGVRSILLEGHKPYKDILAAASQLEATLIVLGRSTSKRSLSEVILGGTLRKVIEASDVPVLVYPLEKNEK